jgi:hypothetical protein
LVIGKPIRYLILGGIAIFIRSKISGSKPCQLVPVPASAIAAFTNCLSPEALAIDMGSFAKLLCSRLFALQFTKILVATCLNIVGC